MLYYKTLVSGVKSDGQDWDLEDILNRADGGSTVPKFIADLGASRPGPRPGPRRRPLPPPRAPSPSCPTLKCPIPPTVDTSQQPWTHHATTKATFARSSSISVSKSFSTRLTLGDDVR